MKKRFEHESSLDSSLRQLDEKIVWNQQRKRHLGQLITSRIQETASTKRRSLVYVSSIALFMAFLFVGYHSFVQTNKFVMPPANEPNADHSNLLVPSRDEKETSQDWQVSPAFETFYTGNDGEEHKMVFLGKEGNVAIHMGPYADEEGNVFDVAPIIAGKGNKYMWYFWGSEEELRGNLKVVGINEQGEKHKVLVQDAGSEKEEMVWEYSNTSYSPLNGADGHRPSNMVFRTPGLWKLNIYINDRFFGDIVVKVEADESVKPLKNEQSKAID